jgi:chromosome segregation ATPase
MKKFAGVVALIMCVAAPAWAAKQMYRWVDAQGKVHYGDTIPPEYAKQGNKEMTKSGRVVKETAPALTPEQIKARAEAEARDKEAKEKAEERARKDKALLASFTTVGELDLAEKRNLEAVDLQIKSNELRIKSVQGRLDGLKKQETLIASRKRPIPPDLVDDIKQTEGEIAHLRGNIADLNREKDALRARYGADRKRYMELKGMPVNADPVPVVAPVPVNKKP